MVHADYLMMANSSKYTEAYSEPSQISKMELFAKIFNDFKPLTISKKASS